MPGGLKVKRRAHGDPRAARGGVAAQPARAALGQRLAQRLRHGGERGECRRRPRRDRADQRRGGGHPGGPQVLSAVRDRRLARRHPRHAADRRGDRRHHQAQCLDLGRRSRLPGRGRLGLGDGGGGALRGDGRIARAGRERRRDRPRAPSRDDLRSGRRARPDPLHRAQRLRRGEGGDRRVAGAARATAPTPCRSMSASRPCARPAAT